MSILVTRPSPAGEELVSRLRTLGQVAWHFPLIEFSPGRQLPQLADQLAALGESDLLFALSQHAVAFAQSQLRSEEHTSELQSRFDLVCRLLLEKKKTRYKYR